MKYTQRGFSVIEVLIVVVVIAILGGIGFIAWQKLMPKPAATAISPAVATSTNCVNAGTVSSAASSDDSIGSQTWNAIDTARVDLPGMQVSFDIPSSLVGKAVCTQSVSGGSKFVYAFSQKSIITNVTCEKYYFQTELSTPSVELWEYAPTDSSQGQGSGVDLTLDEYYTAHKAADGNYVVIDQREYHKLGNNFYVFFGDLGQVNDKDRSARLAACPDADPDYGTRFTDAFNATARFNAALPSSTK